MVPDWTCADQAAVEIEIRYAAALPLLNVILVVVVEPELMIFALLAVTRQVRVEVAFRQTIYFSIPGYFGDGNV